MNGRRGFWVKEIPAGICPGQLERVNDEVASWLCCRPAVDGKELKRPLTTMTALRCWMLQGDKQSVSSSYWRYHRCMSLACVLVYVGLTSPKSNSRYQVRCFVFLQIVPSLPELHDLLSAIDLLQPFSLTARQYAIIIGIGSDNISHASNFLDCRIWRHRSGRRRPIHQNRLVVISSAPQPCVTHDMMSRLHEPLHS